MPQLNFETTRPSLCIGSICSIPTARFYSSITKPREAGCWQSDETHLHSTTVCRRCNVSTAASLELCRALNSLSLRSAPWIGGLRHCAAAGHIIDPTTALRTVSRFLHYTDEDDGIVLVFVGIKEKKMRLAPNSCGSAEVLV